MVGQHSTVPLVFGRFGMGAVAGWLYAPRSGNENP